MRHVEGHFHGLFSFLASGPPPRRLAELLALHRAGIVRFLGPHLELASRTVPSSGGPETAWCGRRAAVDATAAPPRQRPRHRPPRRRAAGLGRAALAARHGFRRNRSRRGAARRRRPGAGRPCRRHRAPAPATSSAPRCRGPSAPEASPGPASTGRASARTTPSPGTCSPSPWQGDRARAPAPRRTDRPAGPRSTCGPRHAHRPQHDPRDTPREGPPPCQLSSSASPPTTTARRRRARSAGALDLAYTAASSPAPTRTTAGTASSSPTTPAPPTRPQAAAHVAGRHRAAQPPASRTGRTLPTRP